MDLFTMQTPEVPWLVYGLLVNDSSSAFIGKPKAGKSSLIRNLAVSIIKGQPFLDRQVYVSKEGGKVLYIHLDRKDPLQYVVNELRELGITQEESARLHLVSALEMPKEGDEYMDWLIEQVTLLKPDLIIIDLLFQFVSVDNSNDYNANLRAINGLQDRLIEAGFHGHLVTAHHARKANGSIDPFDDLLGSSAIRGSFSTNVLLVHDRKNNRHTIRTDQTQRTQEFGEIEEAIIERNSLTGKMTLGSTVASLEIAEKKSRERTGAEDVLHFIEHNSNCTQDDIINGLHMSKIRLKTFLGHIKASLGKTGSGVSGDPYRYSVSPIPMEVQ
jgi:RecA-family ATPase